MVNGDGIEVGIGFAQHDPAKIESAIAEATEAIEEFFIAFNNADNPALRGVTHIPQIMLNRTSSFMPWMKAHR